MLILTLDLASILNFSSLQSHLFAAYLQLLLAYALTLASQQHLLKRHFVPKGKLHTQTTIRPQTQTTMSPQTQTTIKLQSDLKHKLQSDLKRHFVPKGKLQTQTTIRPQTETTMSPQTQTTIKLQILRDPLDTPPPPTNYSHKSSHGHGLRLTFCKTYTRTLTCIWQKIYSYPTCVLLLSTAGQFSNSIVSHTNC